MSKGANKKIACAAYGGGHIKAVLPVLLELRARGWDIALLALTTAPHAARDAGIEPITVDDLLVDGGDHAIRVAGERLADTIPQSPLVPRNETVAYLGFGYQSLVEKFGAGEAEELYASKGRAAFCPDEMAQRFVRMVQPDVTMATNAPRAERAVIEASKAMGIPTICLVDLFAPPAEHWLYDPDYADCLCVLSPFVEQRLVTGGQLPEKIVVTGNPAFAELFDRAPHSLARPERLRVLYISQELLSEDRLHRDLTRAEMCAIAARRPDWEVRVRFYPNETDFGWAAPPLVAPASRPSVIDDLETTDVVVTHGSTMGIEAALLGVPVVQPVGSIMAERAPFDQAGLSIAVREITDLEAAIQQAAQAGQIAVSVPRDPVARVVREIEKLAE